MDFFRTGSAVLGLWLLSGCVAPNPDYAPKDDTPDERSAGADLRTTDGADPLSCRDGERRCRNGGDAWFSQLCQGGRYSDDRRCPVNSSCASGYCQPPPALGTFEGRPCNRENDCFLPQPSSIYSCQPFVRTPGLTIEGYCAQQIGEGLPGTVCKGASASACRSGFCDEVSHVVNGQTNTYCYRSCVAATDCPAAARLCVEARTTVEGVVHSRGKSCVPG